jgi:hydrogenase nickel incorporation protein HypA/HybF
MHEYSVTKSLVDLCIREADKNGFKKIYRIHLTIGRFTGFSADSINFYFDYLKEGTSCQDAEISFKEVPIAIRCRSCNRESTIEEPMLICPQCNAVDIELLAGREFLVESIEGE